MDIFPKFLIKGPDNTYGECLVEQIVLLIAEAKKGTGRSYDPFQRLTDTNLGICHSLFPKDSTIFQ